MREHLLKQKKITFSKFENCLECTKTEKSEKLLSLSKYSL